MKNFMCGYNMTEDQLHMLQSQKLCDLEYSIMSLMIDTKHIHNKQVFVFQNQQLIALHFVARIAQATFTTKLINMLKGTSTLRLFGICNNIFTSKAASDLENILFHNNKLEQLYLNCNLLSDNIQLPCLAIINYKN